MEVRRKASIFGGFILLFIVYHFPEFFSVFWIMAIFKIGFLFVAFLLAPMQGLKGLGGFGLQLKNKWALKLTAGLLLGLLFFSIAFFGSVGLGYEIIKEKVSLSLILRSLPVILLMTAIPSLAEDILTRGYLLAHVKNLKQGFWIFLSALIYLLNHIWRLNDGTAVLTYLFIFGVVLAVAVWFTGSLWLAFGIHWGSNIAYELTTNIPKTENPDFPDGPNWILSLCWAVLVLLLLFFFRSKFLNRKIE